MKKFIISSLIIILSFAIVACVNNEKLDLLSIEDINKLELEDKEENIIYTTIDEMQMKKILKDLSEAIKINKESVNDNPTNINEYYGIRLYMKK